MAGLRQLVHAHMAVLSPTYRTLSAVGAITMLGATIGALFDPVGMSANIGFPLISTQTATSTSTSPSSSSSSSTTTATTPKTTIPVTDHKNLSGRVTDKHSPGWMIVYAGRNSVVALTLLLLNYTGELRALSIVGQLSTVAGLADAYATYFYGIPGSWRGHLYPTVVMSWLGPLGLLLYL